MGGRVAHELGRVCTRLSSGKSLPASKIASSGTYPVYGGNGVRGYTGDANFHGECAVIGRQGAFCGNVRYFSGTAYMTEHAVVAQADSDNDCRYLAYLLSTMNLGQLSGQSAQPGLSAHTLGKLVVELPSLDEQKWVSSVLGALDDKIALNTRMNGCLEELLELEYERQFSGCDNFVPLGDCLDISTASLKPQEHVGEVWEHYSIPAYDSNRWPVVEPATGIKSNKYIVNDNCLLVSKLNPVIKRTWMPVCESATCVCSTEFIVYMPKRPEYRNFFFSALSSADFSRFLCSHTTGSTGSRQRVKPKETLAYPLPAPRENAIADFCRFANPVYALINRNLQETDRLVSIRDALLPMLMSGEIDVSEINVPDSDHSAFEPIER